MDKRLKQRLIGAAVLIALAVIFLPMLLTGRGSHPVSMNIKLPPEPDYHFSNNVHKPLAPLTTQASPATLTPIPNMTTGTTVAPATTPASPPQTAAKPTPPLPSAPTPTVSPKPVTPPSPAASSPVKTAPPARVAKPSAQPAGAGWVVQVASLVDQQRAIQLRNRLRKDGYTAYVDRTSIHSKTYYRVRVGPLDSRNKAEKVLVELEHKVKLKGLVVPVS